MFGKNAAKEQQRIAQQQQAQTNQLVLKAQEPSELQKMWEKASLDFLNYEKSPDFDVTKAPGMAGFVDLYNNAKRGQDSERQGIGLLKMGLNASSPELAAKLAQQAKDRREQEAAGALEGAYKLRRAEATGSVLPLASLNTSRAINLAGISSGNTNNAWQRALQAQQNSGFFNSAFYRAMQEGAKAAAMAA